MKTRILAGDWKGTREIYNTERREVEGIMLVKVNDLTEKKQRLLMELYEDSNIKNALYFYPDMKDIEAGKKKVEENFIDYIKNEFFVNVGNIYYVWEEKGIWISAMRVYKINNNLYYIEALETHPKYRKQGYAEKLMSRVIDELKIQGNFEIKSMTPKENIASQRTHEKCGFNKKYGRAFCYTTNEWVEDIVDLSFRSVI